MDDVEFNMCVPLLSTARATELHHAIVDDLRDVDARKLQRILADRANAASQRLQEVSFGLDALRAREILADRASAAKRHVQAISFGLEAARAEERAMISKQGLRGILRNREEVKRRMALDVAQTRTLLRLAKEEAANALPSPPMSSLETSLRLSDSRTEMGIDYCEALLKSAIYQTSENNQQRISQMVASGCAASELEERGDCMQQAVVKPYESAACCAKTNSFEVEREGEPLERQEADLTAKCWAAFSGQGMQSESFLRETRHFLRIATGGPASSCGRRRRTRRLVVRFICQQFDACRAFIADERVSKFSARLHIF